MKKSQEDHKTLRETKRPYQIRTLSRKSEEAEEARSRRKRRTSLSIARGG